MTAGRQAKGSGNTIPYHSIPKKIRQIRHSRLLRPMDTWCASCKITQIISSYKMLLLISNIFGEFWHDFLKMFQFILTGFSHTTYSFF